ncbi:MAG: hypothetical protein ACERJ1_02685 [Halodesulfovibrio sp.]|uniref:hypothetical protein n=1 Tax=Halodesulfovibrio sp. TaxID=1912772 RepID=UPI00359EDC9B
MEDTKKKSLWARLTGTGSDCGCCCGTIIEETPEAEKERTQPDEDKKTQEKTDTK